MSDDPSSLPDPHDPTAPANDAGSEPIEHDVAPSPEAPHEVPPPSVAASWAPPSGPGADQPVGARTGADAHGGAVALSSQTPSRPRGLWSTRLSLLLVAALVGGLAGHYAAPSSKSNSGLTIKATSQAPGAAILPNGMSIPKLVQRVLPSIVSIKVTGQGSEDQGTGMIITSTGLVVTNNHVIAASIGGGTITVTRSGSTKSLPATLVGTNPVDDVALVRINGAHDLPTVTFGNSNALETGDAVVAIGNALGLAAGTPTVTRASCPRSGAP